jgi:Fe-S cluster biogenesis protein NfuA
MSDQTQQETLQQKVAGVIEQIRPMIQADGGDIELVNVEEDEGVVSIRFQGACVGCPMSAMTLQMGIERNLKAKVPEVQKVVAVQ